jgi:hypothetical protein
MNNAINRVVNRVPFLRTSREFPEDMHMLTVQMNKSWIDLATAVNDRIIGIFPSNAPAITGETWYPTSRAQQTFRKIFPITSTTTIPHELDHFYGSISYFTRSWGQFTDGTNWYGIIGGTNVAIAGQVSIYVDPLNINILVGAGAPALTKGIIILEYMSQV